VVGLRLRGQIPLAATDGWVQYQAIHQ